jgi:hypothetical protein
MTTATAAVPVTTIKPKKYGPFRVLVGRHIEDDPSGRRNPDGRPSEVTYTPASPPFFSSSDLSKLNARDMTPKFALIGMADSTMRDALVRMPTESAEQYAARLKQLAADATRLAASSSGPDVPTSWVPPATLDTMQLKELQALAAEEEVDLKGAKTREDVLKIFKAAMGVK